MNKDQQFPENFSLSEGGPFHKALLKMKLEKQQWKLVILFLCFTWLPLMIATAVEGTLFKGTASFLKDIAMQVRLLLALPMLILIRVTIDNKADALVKYLSEVLIDTEDRQRRLFPLLLRVKKWTNSVLAEIIVLFIVIAIAISPVKGGVLNGIGDGSGSWMVAVKEGNRVLSFSGNWAFFVSIPVFQFFLLRWLWRYIVWIILLFRISRMKLNLKPTHPDQAGGLGVIFIVHRYFILLFFAVGVVISGELMDRLIREPGSFLSIRSEALGFIILCLILLLFPALFFAGKLIKTKQQALLDLGNLGAAMSHRFEGDWVNDRPIETRVSENVVDPSMLYDYSGIYLALQQLRVIPVTFRDLILMAVVLVLPFIPLLFIQFSVAELLQKIFGLLV